MESKIETLRSLIAEFFKDEFYSVGIRNVREAKDGRYYKDSWNDLIRLILLRKLPDGEALRILDEDGNMLLHANTEDEAYRWLNLMLINASGDMGDPILDYREFLGPQRGGEIV